MTAGPAGTAPGFVPARPRPVIRATELGSVGVVKSGSLVLVSDARGDVIPDRRGLGLYRGDTRVLSTLALLVEDRSPTLLRADPGGAASGVVQLTNPDLAADPIRALDLPIALPRQSIGIRRERRIEGEVFRERLAVTNYTEAPQRVAVRLVMDADGADIFEVRGRQRPKRGTLLPVEVGGRTARFRYRALDGGELHTVAQLDASPDAFGAAEANDPGSIAARWLLLVPPGGEVELGWSVTAAWLMPGAARRVTAAARAATPAGPVGDGSDPRAPAPASTVETDDEIVNLILERAIDDLRLLRTPGPGPGEHFVAAGIPWFTTLFGRDSLIAAGSALPFLPELAVDALAVLARLQADGDDPAADAEPGKILHELRTGEMARTGELPFAPLLRLGRRHAALADAARRDRCLDRGRPPRRPPLAGGPAGRSSGSRSATARRGRVPRLPHAGRGRPPQPGLEGLRRRDPRSARDGSWSRRSRWQRCRPTLSRHGAGSPASPAREATTGSPPSSRQRRRRWRAPSTPASGRLTASGTRWRSPPGGGSRTRWRRTLGIASGPAQSRRIGRRRSRAPSSRPRSSPGGASARTRPASPGSTRSVTTRDPSGRTTARSPPRGSSASGSTRRPRRWPGPYSRRPGGRPGSGCPSCSAGSIATPSGCRSSTRSRALRRRGPRRRPCGW